MEAFFIYLLKASVLITVYFLAYHFLLRKETFFTTNRWFLLAGLTTSAVMPLYFITKTIIVERPKVAMEDLIAYSQTATLTPQTETAFTIDWFQFGLISYGLVAFLYFSKIMTNLASLFKLLHKKEVVKKEQFSLVDLDDNIAPFSFFNYIVYNSNFYTKDELQSILLHEKVHGQEKHSIDVMIAKFFCIIFWFNPFMWLYKKAMIQNLEYIADQKASQLIDDKKVYQKALLKVVTHQNCLSITNHFYQSLIKKRIVMLNKNQSHKRNSWKYALILPALVAFILLFQIKVIAQEREIVQKSQEGGVYIKTDKNSSDDEMKKDAKIAKEKFGVTLKYSKVKRNKKGEITGIKIEYKDENGQKGMAQFDSDEPIKPIYFHKNRNTIGFGKSNEVQVFKNFRKNNNPVIADIDDIEIPDMEDMIVDIETPELPEFADEIEAPAVPRTPKMIRKNIVIKKNGKDAQPEVYINGKKMDIPLADLEKMDKDFEGKFEFKGGDNGPFEFKFNDDEIFKMSREDIERIKSDAMENSRIHMKKMKEHMDKMRPQLEKMREDRSNFEWNSDQEEEMQKAREEMQKAREEMLKARDEMIKAREEMQKAKAEQQKARKA
ncbi:M56 family metallopeptidase [Flavobacterium sp. GCM10027622]|uniref:M56 family metallopeptidase n=1 Tax=unclassified Flavobacterium TaxID=196869 RepID=UPI00361664C8